jgi:hypothetical protein
VFKLPTAYALGLLIGIYKGAVFGGSISAISFATPGMPEAAAIVYDGYTLMLQGKGYPDGPLRLGNRIFSERLFILFLFIYLVVLASKGIPGRYS